jgi:hypothetical protein
LDEKEKLISSGIQVRLSIHCLSLEIYLRRKTTTLPKDGRARKCPMFRSLLTSGDESES